MNEDDLFTRFDKRCGLSIADRIDASGDCWQWTGYTDRDGYGKVYHNGGQKLTHRLVWETLVGPIPEDMEIDHLCRVRACVNPDHLEPVTHAENMRRGSRASRTQCRQGHPLSGDNLYVPSRGGRVCRECNRQAVRRYKETP